jgi:LDH2 family malate/lactate/ureidoglycolate dehydrogenase
LHEFVTQCLKDVRVSESRAKMVADVLLAANLRGIDSHGVARLRRYVEGARSGKINPDADITVLRESPSTAALDANNGLGQPAAIEAMRCAIEKAQKTGVGMVTVRRTNHFGIAGYFAMMALEHNMIGVASCNASPQVAPTFGIEPMYGTNPIAVAIPTGGGHQFVLDMATSTVPRGRLEQMRRHGKPLPAGYAIDTDGSSMLNLDELLEGLVNRRGYSLLPLGGFGEMFGGHKGFGLGLTVELLCGPLAGAAWGRHVYGQDGANLGHCFQAVSIDCFLPLDEFKAKTEVLINEIKGSKKVPGSETVYIPGEKERLEAERRSRTGIPLHPDVHADLLKLAEETNSLATLG